ncbi:MAG: hypothetical protein QOE13_1385 [Gaiellaceae bacterium]|nr:hypothetical protein [Gaiellaceae bacterium]
MIELKRRIGLAAALLTSAAALALAIVPSASARDALLAPDRVCPNPAVSAPTRPQIAAMLCYHAYARRRLGLPALRVAGPLYRSAGLKLQWIVACGEFTHTPCGRPFVSAFSAENYTRGNWRVGENLAWGTSSLGRVREIFERWLRSPEHRQNIGRPEWHEIGLSLVRTIHVFGRENVTVWVAHFGSH